MDQMEDTAIRDLSKDEAKIVAVFVLGAGSLLFGLIPAWLKSSRQRFPLIITVLLCFGAGVLLATSLVHMLAEVKEDLPKYAEIIFCIGFFIVYIVDELVHYFWGEAIQHTHGPNRNHVHHNHEESGSGEQANHSENHVHRRSRTSVTQYGSDQETQSLLVRPEGDLSPESCDESASNARICHTAHTEPCEQSFIGVSGLLCALSLHCFLEGLAIGVQDSGTKVTILLLAVSSHKFVVAFCLGLELCANASSRFKSHILAILVFALASVFGILIGMYLVNSKNSMSNKTIPILQGLAGGTLLYVTVCEVLPREKARWHQNREYRSAGLIQLLAVMVGFTAMVIINVYLSDE